LAERPGLLISGRRQKCRCEIALKSPEPDAAKAETYFVRALAVARQQQAKSWELRAAMNLARAIIPTALNTKAPFSIGDALTAVASSKESWWEAEVHRTGGATSARCSKRATCSLRSTAGSRKGSTWREPMRRPAGRRTI
jgi:predicted ATPase